jgi:hypothetical protein
MLTKNKFFFSALLILLIIYVLFGLTNFSFVDSFRNSYEDSIVDPLSYISLFSVLVSFFLLFFSNQIFKLWLHKIVSWFLPLSIFIIWISGGGNDIVDPGRTGYAIFFGFVLVAMTLIFALIHKFKYKR